MRSFSVSFVKFVGFVQHRGPADARCYRPRVALTLLLPLLLMASPIGAVGGPAAMYRFLGGKAKVIFEVFVKPAAAESVKIGVDYVFDPTKRQKVNAYKEDLSGVKNRLNAELASPDNSEAKANLLEREINAADAQLNAIDKLESGLSGKQYQDLLQGVQSSLQEVATTVEDNQRRFDRMESEMRALVLHLASFEARGTGSQYEPTGADLMPPSFNCANARTTAEKLVCSNPQLGDADGHLGKVYSDLRYFMSRSDFNKLRDSERAWIRSRDHRLATECVGNSNVDVQCAISLWRARTEVLQATLQTVRADMPNN